MFKRESEYKPKIVLVDGGLVPVMVTSKRFKEGGSVFVVDGKENDAKLKEVDFEISRMRFDNVSDSEPQVKEEN